LHFRGARGIIAAQVAIRQKKKGTWNLA
jgi:hypothetical protein